MYLFSGDIYSYGICLFQLICGRTPYSASTQWLTFERIRAGKLSFPIGFPEDAEDLITQLVNITESNRLGVDDIELSAIKDHAFFLGIDWANISTTTPPELRAPDTPFLFEVEHTEDVSDAAILRAQEEEARKALIAQQNKTPWAQFLVPKTELIIHQGLLVKRAGIWNNGRKRMFLVTDLPRILYIDADKLVLKGEIPWYLSIYLSSSQS